VRPVAKQIEDENEYEDEEEEDDDIPAIIWHLLFLTPDTFIFLQHVVRKNTLRT